MTPHIRSALKAGFWTGPVAVLFSAPSFAANSGGGGRMPWNSFLTNLKDDLTGPTAGIVALIAFFALGYQLAWGGEMGDFARRLIILGMVVAFLVAGASGLSAMGITGALV